jgi:hypothetical protein
MGGKGKRLHFHSLFAKQFHASPLVIVRPIDANSQSNRSIASMDLFTHQRPDTAPDADVILTYRRKNGKHRLIASTRYVPSRLPTRGLRPNRLWEGIIVPCRLDGGRLCGWRSSRPRRYRIAECDLITHIAFCYAGVCYEEDGADVSGEMAEGPDLGAVDPLVDVAGHQG